MIKLGQYLQLHSIKNTSDFNLKLAELFNLKLELDIMTKLEEFKAIEATKITSNKFKIGKKTFKFNQDFETISFEQWLYFNDFIDEEKLDVTTQNIPYILALFLQQVNIWGKTARFDKNKLDEVAEYLEKNMDIKVALGLTAFFLKLEQTLLRCMSHQYTQQVETWVKQQIQK